MGVGALIGAFISASQPLAFSALTSMRGTVAVAGFVIFLVGIVAFLQGFGVGKTVRNGAERGLELRAQSRTEIAGIAEAVCNLLRRLQWS